MGDDLESFESVRLILNSAETTINKIEGEVATFIDDCIGPIRRDLDYETREKIIYITLKKPFPESIRTDTYHVVSDIKHALDQCVGDAAILLGRPDARGLHFPIGKTAADFNNEVKRRLHNVDADLKSYIVSLDTNERGNSGLYRFLAMSGPNKHQRIVGLTTTTGTILVSDNLYVMRDVAFNIGKWHRRKNEIEFIRIGANGFIHGKGNLYDVFEPILRVTFKEGKQPFDKPLPATLRRFFSECKSICLGIETEAERILRERT